MRTIKFEYGFSSVNGIVKKQYYLHEIPNIKEKCDVWNVLPIAYVRQFSGLHDKNGKEIYEGDIVTDGVGKYKIVYDLKLAGYQPYCIFRDDPENYCEVLGNIYENPELISKTPTHEH